MSSAPQKLQEKAGEIVRTVNNKINEVSTTNAKTVDLWPNTVDYQKKDNVMTTDHGVKVQDTDNWLKAVGGDGRPGPSLLEDQIAREKIHRCMNLRSFARK